MTDHRRDRPRKKSKICWRTPAAAVRRVCLRDQTAGMTTPQKTKTTSNTVTPAEVEGMDPNPYMNLTSRYVIPIWAEFIQPRAAVVQEAPQTRPSSTLLRRWSHGDG
jgi:hypothetical protein